MSADPARAELDARVLAWTSERDLKPDDARFEALALDLFTFQFEHCAPFARFCTARGRTPAQVTSWREIPPVPTGAFKEIPLRCFEAERTLQVFRTSGSSTSRRGELLLDTLALYEHSLLWSFRHYVLPDLEALGGRILLRILAPCPQEQRDSSLSYMFGCLLASMGAPGSGFDVQDGHLRIDPLLRTLERASAESLPVALCGTAFAFVHLVDALARRQVHLTLPPGSRIMETGGFKGRSRRVPRVALYAALEEHLSVPPRRVVNQYGMTELASQFYDPVLVESEASRAKRAPPWARVRIVDPETGREVRPGETGGIQVFDLANTGSVLALQTADVGRPIDEGFEVVGREPGAEARGCSIAADAMLADAPP